MEVKSGHSLRTAGMVQFRKHIPIRKSWWLAKMEFHGKIPFATNGVILKHENAT